MTACVRGAQLRAQWARNDPHRNPGYIQYDGSLAADGAHITLEREHGEYQAKLGRAHELARRVTRMLRPGCSEGVLDAALLELETLQALLAMLEKRENGAE